MKLKFDVQGRTQPDPFIFEDGGKFYLYVTAHDGVEAYEADSPLGLWHFRGIVASFEGKTDYWAPSVTKIEGKYYIYVSCSWPGAFEHMHVAQADSPLGPFTREKELYDRFSIDSHVVETEKGIFLWYAEDNLNAENGKVGTRVYIDRLIDPYTPAHQPREVIIPEFDEEKFTPQCTPERDWYTIEGAFWFEEDGWQYVMYSGGCYRDDTYHIGYAAAKTDEKDLTQVDFAKHTKDGGFSPVLIKNEFEEGTGHHSVLKWNGEYYAIYHGRDWKVKTAPGYEEARTARICRLHVKAGMITAERYEDHI